MIITLPIYEEVELESATELYNVMYSVNYEARIQSKKTLTLKSDCLCQMSC